MKPAPGLVVTLDWSEVVRTSRSRSSPALFGFCGFPSCSAPCLDATKLRGRLSSVPDSSSSPYIVPIASVTWWLGSEMDSWLAWPRRFAKLLPTSRNLEVIILTNRGPRREAESSRTPKCCFFDQSRAYYNVSSVYHGQKTIIRILAVSVEQVRASCSYDDYKSGTVTHFKTELCL